MDNDADRELAETIQRIVKSESRKKLVVAGPGTGKTTLFKTLLDAYPGGRDERLVLTFINNLQAELEEKLGAVARVATLHGFCQSLLRTNTSLRAGLTKTFRCVPQMASLVESDWECLKTGPCPRFVSAMRNLDTTIDCDFYLSRGNFYDAVDFDDSVFRVTKAVQAAPGILEGFELVLIDEFQDFNRMEAILIDGLGAKSALLIAGDDDQALYGQLRGASWDHIRERSTVGGYEVFCLPFCMRCPEAVVGAVNDVITRARELKKLKGRIEKPYKYHAGVKGEDSRRHPHLIDVETTVQRKNANYFGKYIERFIKQLPAEERSAESEEATILIIGPQQFRDPVAQYLADAGFTVEGRREPKPDGIAREAGIAILATDKRANIGWRIVLEHETPDLRCRAIRDALASGVALVDVLPKALQDRVAAEVEAWKPKEVTVTKAAEPEAINKSLRIKVTSFEGAKGLAAPYVFILGMHEGDLPKHANEIQDIEICRFVVGLTRTRRLCSLLRTRRFGDKVKAISAFLSWIDKKRMKRVIVDAKTLAAPME